MWARFRQHSPFIQGSACLHGAVALGVMAHPPAWPWAVTALVLNHAALTAAGLWPRSHLLGPNWTRLPDSSAARREIALTLDDGPDPDVTPRLLDQLDQLAVRATFFCIGHKVTRFPAIAREIVRRGHDIENHTEHHSHRFAFLGPAKLSEEIARAQDSIAGVTGRLPQFFRAPAGLRNPLLQPVLSRLNLQLAAWTRRGFDTVTADSARVQSRLLKGLQAGDILLLHDGNGARTASSQVVAQDVLPAIAQAARGAALNWVTLRQART